MNWKDFKYEEWKKEFNAFDHKTFNAKVSDALNSDTIEGVSEKLKEVERPPWTPFAHYVRDSDMIVAYASDELSYSKWICPGITLFISQETDEVIGIEIHGVKQMIAKGVKGNQTDVANINEVVNSPL